MTAHFEAEIGRVPDRDRQPLLSMVGIQKRFPGVHALKGVDLVLQAGEVLAVVGENGAGKSTLIKVLAGAHAPDAGRLVIDGEDVAFRTPLEAQRSGVGVIYQEFNLIPSLTVRENIFLGHETPGTFFISRRDERARAAKLFEKLGIDIQLERRCSDLSVAQQQLVEIAKALSLGARILVMDEPTATLTGREVETLFAIISDLKAQKIGVIYISHRLDEVFDVADRVTILRDGARVGTYEITEVTRGMLIEKMVGRSLEHEFPERKPRIGDVRLSVKGLTRGTSVRNVSFDVRQGEVVGLTGLVGAGRTEVARLIFGADRADAGEILLDGRLLRVHKPSDAIRAGICLLPEDRKTQGLVLGLSARENFALPNLDHWSRMGFVHHDVEREVFSRHLAALRIKVSHQDQTARNLSGGNQQKVLLARWLESNTDVVIFDEPTRGIDVGSRFEIYQLINQLADAGKAIIMISSELPEVLGMSDRILVMHEGCIVGEISDAGTATQEGVMRLAVGNRRDAAVESAKQN